MGGVRDHERVVLTPSHGLFALLSFYLYIGKVQSNPCAITCIVIVEGRTQLVVVQRGGDQ